MLKSLIRCLVSVPCEIELNKIRYTIDVSALESCVHFCASGFFLEKAWHFGLKLTYDLGWYLGGYIINSLYNQWAHSFFRIIPNEALRAEKLLIFLLFVKKTGLIKKTRDFFSFSQYNFDEIILRRIHFGTGRMRFIYTSSTPRIGAILSRKYKKHLSSERKL